MTDKNLDRQNKKAPHLNPDKTPMRTGNPQLDPAGKDDAAKPSPERPHAPPTGSRKGQN
jgi:hypothetical protein